MSRLDDQRIAVRASRSPDRGASALTIALSMVLLMGLAAVALDATGMGFNERRQDQSAADVAALAAVQFADPADVGHAECSGLTGIAMSRCNGAVEAREVANATLDDPSIVDWTNSSKCATPPTDYTTVSAVSECIAFSSNNQRAWVRIPRTDNPTSFGRVIGFDFVSTSADAIAGTEWNPPGGVLPFLLPGNAASTNYNCMKAGSNPNWGPCEDLPTTGNFGSADFFLYGDSSQDWDQKCSGDTNGRLVANIARGVDHPLGLYDPTNPDQREEEPGCPDWGTKANTVDSQTGIGSNLEQGLLYGDSTYAPSAYPGAVQDDSPSGLLVRNGGGSTDPAWVNDTPLWDFLIDDGNSVIDVGEPCDDDLVDTPLLMEACLVYAKTAPAKVIFTDDLANAMRFGWVPELMEPDFTGNPYHIVDYRPIYLDTTWYKCSSADCRIMHTPGVPDSTLPCPANPPDSRITCGIPGDKNDNLEAITSWILHKDIVPDNAKTPPPGSANQRTYNLID